MNISLPLAKGYIPATSNVACCKTEMPRHAQPTPDAITTVCFRVTRACNLRCSYCQAPPTGSQQSYEQMVSALRWLRAKGALRIKFTGGEPFVFDRLSDLVMECRQMAMEPTIVTNGTLISDFAIERLVVAGARLKISLHGPRAIHDNLQGREVYSLVRDNMRRLIAAGIETSVHTLIYRNSRLRMNNWIRAMINEGVHKISFMPFVARGRGQSLAATWSLTSRQCEQLRARIAAAQSRFKKQIVVRYINFLTQPYIVFETDGRLLLEMSTEDDDVSLQMVPTALGLFQASCRTEGKLW